MTRQEAISALLLLALLGLAVLCNYDKDDNETDSGVVYKPGEKADENAELVTPAVPVGPPLSALNDPAFAVELQRVNVLNAKPVKACDGLRSIEYSDYGTQMTKRYERKGR